MELDARGSLDRNFKLLLLAIMLLGAGPIAYALGTSTVGIVVPGDGSAPQLAEVEDLSRTGHENWGPYDDVPDFLNRPFSRAKLAYRSTTGSGPSYPKYRTWDGENWSQENEAPPATDNLYWVEVEHCPTSVRPEEWIFAASDASGYLNYYVWDGASWHRDNVHIDNGALKRFDVAYERTSGDALLVYSKGTVNPDLYYKIWNGKSWSSETGLDLSGSRDVDLVRMESMPDPRDEIALVAVTSEPTAFAKIWYQDSWDNENRLSPSGSSYSSTTWSADVAYEQDSFDALFVYNVTGGQGGVRSKQWSRDNGWGPEKDTGLSTSPFVELVSQGGVGGDNVMLASVYENRSYGRVLWDGTSWGTPDATQDLASDLVRRNFDLAWDPHIMTTYVTSENVIEGGVKNFKNAQADNNAYENMYEEKTNWWNDNWIRRRPININNTSNGENLENYQVKISPLEHDSDMQSDFGDLRFIDNDQSTELSYWIENYVSNDNAVIWVKVPQIPANDNHKIYMYYGNPTASTRSTMENTMIPFEVGKVSVSNTWSTVNLNNAYDNAVIVTVYDHPNTTDPPAVVRVRDVNSTSFQIRLQNPSGSYTPSENYVHYIVMEEGQWQMLDGRKIEAQKYLSTQTDHDGSWTPTTQSYLHSYTNPVVLGQVMSYNDSDWSVFWCSDGSSNENPPDSSGIATGKHVGEDGDTTRANENVGFIVVEQGSGTILNDNYETALGSAAIELVYETPPYSYSLNFTPEVGIATQAAMDGTNGGWAVLYGSGPLEGSQIDLAIVEDWVGDQDGDHVAEQVSYFVLESAGSYPLHKYTSPEPTTDVESEEGTAQMKIQHDITGIPSAHKQTLQVEYYITGDEEDITVRVENFASGEWENIGVLSSRNLDNFTYQLTSNLMEGPNDENVHVRFVQTTGDQTRTSLMIDFTRVNSYRRLLVFASENVYDNTIIAYQTWLASSEEWGEWQELTVDGKPYWIELERNPRLVGEPGLNPKMVRGDNKILGAYLEAWRSGGEVTDVYLIGLRWNGSELLKARD